MALHIAGDEQQVSFFRLHNVVLMGAQTLQNIVGAAVMNTIRRCHKEGLNFCNACLVRQACGTRKRINAAALRLGWEK
jgi:hypothetical protein